VAISPLEGMYLPREAARGELVASATRVSFCSPAGVVAASIVTSGPIASNDDRSNACWAGVVDISTWAVVEGDSGDDVGVA
jgi:hypothetical protein